LPHLQEIYRKSIRIIFGTLIIYALLVSTHLGEFWPFSIYPMFSQAGNPWKRAIVRDVTAENHKNLWQATNQQNLVGQTVPLNELNINTNDIANLLSKTKVWNDRKVKGVRKLFSDELNSKQLLLLQAQGSLVKDDSVQVRFVPFIYLSKDTTILNSKLKTQ